MGRSVLRCMIGGLGLLLVLTACAGKSSSNNTTGQNGGPVTQNGVVSQAGGGDGSSPRIYTGPTATPRPSAPRNRTVPDGDPALFEAPFNVGQFIRQTAQGRTVGTETGGVQATYTHNADTIVLTVYYFDDPAQAINTVQYVLENKNVTPVTELFSLTPISYGIVQDQRGGYLAAWSHYGWAFIVRTPAALDTLNGFLDAFPF
jgi:hypothetical protein